MMVKITLEKQTGIIRFSPGPAQGSKPAVCSVCAKDMESSRDKQNEIDFLLVKFKEKMWEKND